MTTYLYLNYDGTWKLFGALDGGDAEHAAQILDELRVWFRGSFLANIRDLADEARLRCVTPTGEAAIKAESDWHTQRAFLDLLRRRPELCNFNGEGEINIVLREAYLTLDAVLSAMAKRPVTLADAQLAHTPALSVTPTGSDEQPRRGRLSKEESSIRKTQMLLILRQHLSLKDDPATLANMTGVSESTIRRWLDEEEQTYRDSMAANPEPEEE